MILIFCFFLVLTPVNFVASGNSPDLPANKTTQLNEIKNLIDKLISDEDLRQEKVSTTGVWVPWTTSRNGLPFDFVIGGTDDHGWYGVVIRANYSNNWIPGKYNPDAHTAFVSFNGRENGVSDFEILTHNNYVLANKMSTTGSLIDGGYENGRRTFICKTRHSNEWVCGKLYNDVCKVPWGGVEYVYEDWVALQLRE